MLFFGLLHHCAMPNRSNSSRTGLILQYLPKYIRCVRTCFGAWEHTHAHR